MKILFFRFTGIILLVFSIYSTFFSKNLFLKFLGSTFLFLILFIIFYYILIFFLYLKNKIEFVSLGDGLLYPFKNSIIEVEYKNIPMIFPAMYFSINFNIYEKNLLLKKINSTISVAENSKLKFSVEFPRHGEFNLKDFKFIIKDIFGLTQFDIKIDFHHIISVLPYFTNEVEIPFFTEEGGEEVIQTLTKINSTDFFENRKYYPGDDVRKLNWKVFAHSGELHIREVEKVPPKVGKLSIIFAPYSHDLVEYEYISSLFLGTAYYLLKNNFELEIIAPFSNKIFHIEEDKEKDFNQIVNSSFVEFNFDITEHSKNSLVFCSFYEYQKFFKKGQAKNKFYIISFYKSIEDVKKLINSIIKIDKFDNLFKELYYKFKEIRKQRLKDNNLTEYKENAIRNKIKLEICRVDDEYFKKF